MSIVHRARISLVVARSAVAALILAPTMMWGAPAAAQVAGGEPTAEQASNHSSDRLVFIVDVAEDLTRFTPTFVKPTDTQPERGAFFVTEGKIFPPNTIKGEGATFDPNSDGAIGRWFCRGTHLVSASDIPAAPLWVNTAQLYLLPRDTQSIATEGVEGGGTIVRTVAGGTGQFREYAGEQKQEFLGFNATGGVNLRVTFTLRKVTR